MPSAEMNSGPRVTRDLLGALGLSGFVREAVPGKRSCPCPALVDAWVSNYLAPGYRDVKLETGEIMVKANWKFGPTAVVAKY
jgi:hypothetical protein